ncbi:hypothetical protein ERO13_A13G089800v2 [Gossypium hirsutum]|nr:WD repeat-containing protein 3 homolog isoform X5 [Gossypium hirsutum]XP_040942022.1 WD repeat-containing protein 3 homolog isoform X5 [Gossypium hirsutum]TYH91303.1 hypothetical protein ES332_A13G108600v1 [Gossypium tomentosum]KAG4165650.1 hypothetical protein ERO13_A13G089800v2 [Gossypium hirsutum]TYH91304.1 hypothetical protein ES332_A13G108600v1 [Gossypium tomentosum]TYH91306.1 hypothetical protein ES332_A13G108600v1 [Gossypium tomentosum]TYH91308.1 hypothetical protein ES332_A13G10860
MQMFGALQSATVVTLLLQDLMTGPFAVGIVLRSLFLLRKKKRRLEEIFEADIDNTFENKHIPNSRGGSCCISREEKLETLTATDSIIDALDVAEVELKRIAEHEDEKARGKVAEFQPNMIMLGLSPSDYVLRALSYISTNDLEQTLQLFSAQALPFSDALKLLSYTKDWTSNPDKVELVCRIVKVLLQIHHSQLISTPSARPVLAVLKEIIYALQ